MSGLSAPLRQPRSGQQLGEGRRQQDPRGHDHATPVTMRPAPDYAAEHPVVRTHPETGRGALRQHRPHVAFQGHERGGEQPCSTICSSIRPARIHLPVPLARRLARLLGQSLRAALSGQRLSRLPPLDAAHRARRRRAPLEGSAWPGCDERSHHRLTSVSTTETRRRGRHAARGAAVVIVAATLPAADRARRGGHHPPDRGRRRHRRGHDLPRLPGQGLPLQAVRRGGVRQRAARSRRSTGSASIPPSPSAGGGGRDPAGADRPSGGWRPARPPLHDTTRRGLIVSRAGSTDVTATGRSSPEAQGGRPGAARARWRAPPEPDREADAARPDRGPVPPRRGGRTSLVLIKLLGAPAPPLRSADRLGRHLPVHRRHRGPVPPAPQRQDHRRRGPRRDPAFIRSGGHPDARRHPHPGRVRRHRRLLGARIAMGFGRDIRAGCSTRSPSSPPRRWAPSGRLR